MKTLWFCYIFKPNSWSFSLEKLFEKCFKPEAPAFRPSRKLQKKRFPDGKSVEAFGLNTSLDREHRGAFVFEIHVFS